MQILYDTVHVGQGSSNKLVMAVADAIDEAAKVLKTAAIASLTPGEKQGTQAAHRLSIVPSASASRPTQSGAAVALAAESPSRGLTRPGGAPLLSLVCNSRPPARPKG